MPGFFCGAPVEILGFGEPLSVSPGPFFASVAFVAGAVVGNLFIPLMGTHMIWLSPAALLVVILVMFIDREKQVLEAHGKSAK